LFSQLSAKQKKQTIKWKAQHQEDAFSPHNHKHRKKTMAFFDAGNSATHSFL